MFVSVHFPSAFELDDFSGRRTTGHNLYDPESLLTGGEISHGYTYANSTRDYISASHYLHCIDGTLSPDEIALGAPRVFKIRKTTPYIPAALVCANRVNESDYATRGRR